MAPQREHLSSAAPHSQLAAPGGTSFPHAGQVVGPVVVVSRDPAIIAHAETQGAWGLPEASPGLNPALAQAAHFAQTQGATGLLILPTDLPQLTTTDLKTTLALDTSPKTLVIAPCRHGTGTNALRMRPPHLIPFRFGPDSFAAHSAAARAAGVEAIIYRAASIAFDLDTPEDWGSGIRSQGIGESGNRETGNQRSGEARNRETGIGT